MARLRRFSSEYTCVYMCMCGVCTHIYKRRVLILFWEGEVGHPQSEGEDTWAEQLFPRILGLLPKPWSWPFPSWIATVPKSSISHGTE